jgi:hypothetical protein
MKTTTLTKSSEETKQRGRCPHGGPGLAAIETIFSHRQTVVPRTWPGKGRQVIPDSRQFKVILRRLRHALIDAVISARRVIKKEIIIKRDNLTKAKDVSN